MTDFRGFSSNMKELMTIWFALLVFERRDSVILIRTDNSTPMSAIIKANSTKYNLNNIQHIAGFFNDVADQLSRHKTI